MLTTKINYEYIGKDSFNAPQTTHIYIEINIYTHKATLVKFNNFLQWPYSDKTIYFYIGQVKIDNTSATVTQNHLGDVYFDLRYKQLKNTAFISDEASMISFSAARLES